MRITYPPNSRPAKPWARRWMIWLSVIVIMFIPYVIWDIARVPWFIIKDRWEEASDEALSWKIDRDANK